MASLLMGTRERAPTALLPLSCVPGHISPSFDCRPHRSRPDKLNDLSYATDLFILSLDFNTTTLLLIPPPLSTFYVITVGAVRPVNSSNRANLIAKSANGFNTSELGKPCLVTSGSYFSKYILTVAPVDPVPDKRNTALVPSPNINLTPCFVAWLPSTGSVYAKSSTSVKVKPFIVIPGMKSGARKWAIMALAASASTVS